MTRKLPLTPNRYKMQWKELQQSHQSKVWFQTGMVYPMTNEVRPNLIPSGLENFEETERFSRSLTHMVGFVSNVVVVVAALASWS